MYGQRLVIGYSSKPDGLWEAGWPVVVQIRSAPYTCSCGDQGRARERRAQTSDLRIHVWSAPIVLFTRKSLG